MSPSNSEQPLYSAGEQVAVFYRIGASATYLPVMNKSAALRTPRIGQSYGWVKATVLEDYFDRDDKGVRVRYDHTKWVNRSGHALDTSDPQNLVAIHPARRVRPLTGASVQNHTGILQKEVTLSIVMVRWADKIEEPNRDAPGSCDYGWGPTGSVVSDSYIESWIEAIDVSFLYDYQVISVFVQNSSDLQSLAQASFSLSAFLTGRHLCAMYFLWPVSCLDDKHILWGYVNERDMMLAMKNIEASGVATRFPHPSHLYKVFLSKDWTSQLCLFPEMRVPATTKVSRSAVERDARGAAEKALATLQSISSAQLESERLLLATHERERGQASLNGFANRGVAKLGYSWEAHDVFQFDGVDELAERMTRLFDQKQNTSESVFVQALVEDADLEIRTFVVHGDPVAHARRYTRYEASEEATGCNNNHFNGRFHCFQRFDRSVVIKKFFDGDGETLVDAERQVDALIKKYVMWLMTECTELPAVFRFDAFVRRVKGVPGRADVFAGELTELGGSSIGWDVADMTNTLYPAVLGSFFDDVKCMRSPNCPCAISDGPKRVSLRHLVKRISKREARKKLTDWQGEK